MRSELKYQLLEEEAGRQLYELLNRVSFLHVQKPKAHDFDKIDFVIEVEHSGEKRLLLLEVKHNAQIRDARNTIDRMQRVRSIIGQPTYLIFISEYLSQSIRDFCKEQNVGYFDFSGNCLLEFDHVFIERLMPGSDKREKKHYKSLFSPKSSRVIRRVLKEPNRLWKVQNLALEAEVSAATVSLVKDKLLGDSYAARRGEAFIITQPDRLLQQWARQYEQQNLIQVEYYARGDVEEIEKRFASYCNENSIEYAFTLFSGAKRTANFTRGVQRGYSYVAPRSDIEKIARDLDLKAVDSGGNFLLMVPADEDVFFDNQDANGETVVSDIQLYLDLFGHPGRGEENAEYLLDTRIRRQW